MFVLSDFLIVIEFKIERNASRMLWVIAFLLPGKLHRDTKTACPPTGLCKCMPLRYGRYLIKPPALVTIGVNNIRNGSFMIILLLMF